MTPTQTFATLRSQFLSGPPPVSDKNFLPTAQRQMLNDAIVYGERATDPAQAEAWQTVALQIAATIDGKAHIPLVDAPTLDMVGSLLYDVGHLTFDTLNRETCGKTLFENWRDLSARLAPLLRL